jgi:lipopolysaccharide export system protein LptC
MTIPARLKLLLALVVLAVISWNTVDISTIDENKQPLSDNQLDFYASGINTLQTDINGKAKNRLTAKKMRHYEKDDRTELEHPVATLYQTDTPPWVIKAKQGVATSKGKKITLQKKVSIRREGHKTARPLLITTESLIYEPDRNYTETADPIRLKIGSDVINSVGMTGYIQEPMQIELLSNVRGEYAAP